MVRDGNHPPHPNWGEGVRPPEAQVVVPGEPINLKPYTDPRGQPGKYVYAISERGNMIVAPEHGSSTMRDGTTPRRTTHVDLLNKGPGRTSGEITPTNDPNVYVMNDDSGRYSRQPAPDGGLEPTRTGDQLRNANDLLNTAKLDDNKVYNEADLYGPTYGR